MKKILTEYTQPPLAYQRLTHQGLDHLQSAYKEGLQALLSSVQTDPVTVTMIAEAALSEDGNDVTVTDGWGAYGGEIFQVDAQTISIAVGKKAVWKVEETFAAHDPALFTDGNEHNIHSIQKLKLFEDDPGNGLSDWDTTKYINDPWHDLILETGWQKHTTVFLDNGTPGFRKDRAGNLQLIGVLEAVDGQGSSLITTLPEGYRPSRQFTIPCRYALPPVTNGTANNVWGPFLTLYPNGEIKDLNRDSSQAVELVLSGICIPLV